jgi:outer membrane protein TolC
MKQIKPIVIIVLIILSNMPGNAQTLDDYFRIAAENNPGLMAKYREYEAAMQNVAQVRSLTDPTLSFGYFISRGETRVGPQIARFSLNQMFPWFGTLKAQGDVESLLAESKFQTFLDARNKLYFQVAAAYYLLVELEQWQLIEEENIEILQSFKNISNVKFRNGSGPMVDVLRVDIMLNGAQTNLDILDDKEKPFRARFNKLLNRPENEPVNVVDSLHLEALDEYFLKDSLFSENPLLNEVNLKQKAAEAGEFAANKQGMPKMGIGLDFVIIGERSDMEIPDNGKDVIMPMLSVSIPIFRGKYKAAVKESQLMQESFALQKKELRNSLLSEYEMLWFEIQQQKQLHELYGKQIQTTEQSLNLLLTAYGNSGSDFEEVLRIQQQLLSYGKMKVTAEIQYLTALANLNYLTAKTYNDENK